MKKILLTSVILAVMPLTALCFNQPNQLAKITKGYQTSYSAGVHKSLNDQSQLFKQLLIIDKAVHDTTAFVQNLPPDIAVAYIKSEHDGIAQLTHILQQYQQLESVHLMSHAADASLQLGNTPLTPQTLNSDLYQALNQAVVPGGDLLLYGCELSATQQGKAFTRLLKQNTHLDIASSTDKTGESSLGGDWTLEHIQGQVDINHALIAAATRYFNGVLPPSALPVISSTPITNTNEDAPYAYAAAASDTDTAETLSWAVKSGETLPGWLALSAGSKSTTDVGSSITGPGGVAIDAAGNIYVAGLSGTTIFKITPDGTQTSFATVHSSSKYGMLVIGSTLYVSYYNLNKITKIDLTNPGAGETDWINPITDPLAMLEKDNFIYVAQYSSNKISKIDLSDNSVSDVVTGTPYPFGIGFSKDGTLYIASYNNKYISSFKDDVLSANIKSFGSSLSDIKIDDNDNIYVSTFGSGVKRITPDLSTTTDISTTGRVWGMSLSASGALIWGINDFNKVVKLETGTVLSGTPTNDDVGDHDICLTVTDATNNVDQCFTLTVNNVNDTPVAANNTGLSLDEGAAGTISQTELEFSDVDATDTPGNLTYTLTTVPIYGSLQLNGNTLALNDTFSQQDINDGLISYQHDDSENFSD
ncbi:MAG: sugar lactone lactonase YvrE, partial [Paraglaciecola sp.]